MPPLASPQFNSREELTNQLTNPSDIFSVLLILGGDVVCRAIAQLAGLQVTPVAFSFGVLIFSYYCLMSDRHLQDGSPTP